MPKHRCPPTRRWAPLLVLVGGLVTRSTWAMPAKPGPEQAPRFSCNSDDQCGRGTYCDLDHKLCVPVRKPINVMYLFYLSRDRQFTEALGLYWHQKGQRGYRVGLPLYWSFWSPERRTRVVLPLYFDQWRQGERHLVVPPLQYRRTALATKLRVWPLFFYSKEGAAARSVALLPLFYRARVGGYSNTVLPLFLSFARNDPGAETSEGLIGGLFYWRTRRQLRQRMLIPLVHYQSSPRGTFLWAAPLNFYWSGASSRGLLAFPLLLHHSDRRGSTTMSLLPFYHHSSQDRQRLYLPPLFVHHRTGPSRFVSVGPSYYYRNPDTTAVGLAPLLFTGWSAQRSHHVLFPLLWHLRSPGSRTVVLGPGYYHRDGSRRWAGLAPLLFYKQTPSSLSLDVLPLLSFGSHQNGEQRHLITPLFFHETDRQRQRSQWALLAPPYYQLRTPRLQVDLQVPLFVRWHNAARQASTWVLGGSLWWHRSPTASSHGLFPLYWHFGEPRSGNSSTLLFPLAFHQRRGEERRLLILPLLYRQSRSHRSTTLTLVPPMYLHRSPERSRLFVPPIFFYHRAGEDLTWAVGPGYYYRRGDRHRLGLAPLLFSGWSVGRRHLVLWPLLWHVHSPQSSTWVVGPGYHLRRGTRTSAGLAPLLFYSRSEHSRSLTLLPLFHHASFGAGERSRFISPLFIYERDQREQLSQWATLAPPYYRRRQGGREVDVLFPLVWRVRSPQSSTWVVGPGYCHRRRSHLSAGLAPLLWHFSRPGHSFTLAGLYSHHREPGHVGHSLWPLLHYRRTETPAGPRTTAAVLPAMFYQSRPRGRSLLTPLFGFHQGSSSRTWYAGPYIDHRRGQQRTRVLFPLLWGQRRSGRAMTIAAPVLWDFHVDQIQRTTVVFPLGWRHRNEVGRTTTYASPLLWLHRHPHGTDAVAFPLLWHFGGRRRSSTVVFPLLWHFRRPTRRATVLFPVYWDFGRGERRTTVALNTLYIRNRARRTYDFHFLPLVRVQRKRPTDIKLSLLAGLFGYERIGRNRYLKLLLIPFDLGPAKRSDH